MPRLVISCGAKKKDHMCKARDMYVGGLYVTNRRYAEHFYPGNWFILSGKYGIIHPDMLIETYEATLDPNAEITNTGVLKGKIHFLGSRPYAKVLQKYCKVKHLLGTIQYAGMRQKYLNMAIKENVKVHKIKLPEPPRQLMDKEVLKLVSKGYNITQIREVGSCCQARFTRLTQANNG